MGTIKDEAKAYTSKASVRNISELTAIDTNLVIFEDKEAEFPYKYIEIDGERFKMPVSVLSNLKVILEENPDLKAFKVKKSGEGMDSRYTVIPLS